MAVIGSISQVAPRLCFILSYWYDFADLASCTHTATIQPGPAPALLPWTPCPLVEFTLNQTSCHCGVLWGCSALSGPHAFLLKSRTSPTLRQALHLFPTVLSSLVPIIKCYVQMNVALPWVAVSAAMLCANGWRQELVSASTPSSDTWETHGKTTGLRRLPSAVEILHPGKFSTQPHVLEWPFFKTKLFLLLCLYWWPCFTCICTALCSF